MILIAGKGHEDYQEIKGVKYPMYDRDMVYEVVEEMGGIVCVITSYSIHYTKLYEV